MLTFSVVTIGCKVNRVESDSLSAFLLSLGAKEADKASADVIVVNTCAVTSEAEKKTRKAIRRCLRLNLRANLVVTGCGSALDPQSFIAMDDRVEVVEKSRLSFRMRELFAPVQENSIPAQNTPSSRHDAPFFSANDSVLRIGGSFRTRVGVKVQDGCNHACTYCVVCLARGVSVSRPVDDIVSEVCSYALAGVEEIVLTGIDLGSYLYGCLDIAGLLEYLLAATKGLAQKNSAPRFRLSSIEPVNVSPDLIDLLATSEGRVCRHLHLPLQSGSFKVLSEMARPYSPDDYFHLTEILYDAIPELSLTTDIIVGFPGETERDFNQTLALAKSCWFSHIHVFPYSQRKNTSAGERNDQIPSMIKAKRAESLRSLARDMTDADYTRRVGSEELVLVESHRRATTESYHVVAPPAGGCIGKLVPVLLSEERRVRSL